MAADARGSEQLRDKVSHVPRVPQVVGVMCQEEGGERTTFVRLSVRMREGMLVVSCSSSWS